MASVAPALESSMPEGTYVLAYRGGMPHGRPCSKLQYRWTGPWRVLERGVDEAHPRVRCIHLASKVIEEFSLHDLKVCNLELLDSEERCQP